eukprot:scaffold8156_cov92-Isochrysis_galbana.AAC.3
MALRAHGHGSANVNVCGAEGRACPPRGGDGEYNMYSLNSRSGAVNMYYSEFSSPPEGITLWYLH